MKEWGQEVLPQGGEGGGRDGLRHEVGHVDAVDKEYTVQLLLDFCI